jgi:hypothetical protein
MNEHELDDQMRHLAQTYNEPPATPRDAMWARIESARAGTAVVAIGHARRMYWLRMGAGIAAVLVVGIGIGRLTNDLGRAPAATLASADSAPPAESLAGSPVTTVASTARASDDTDDTGAAIEPAASADQDGGAAANRVRATRDDRIRALRAGRAGSRQALSSYGVPRSVPGAVGEGSEMSAYRLAVVEHMARAEVLLTSFLADSRTSPNDTRAVAQFASLSRDLLKTTRLLLATHSTDDPALTRLLEDLELVLMQISQYATEGRRSDLDAINQSLDRRNVLPKLRSTIPAGASASSGT